MSGHRNQKSPSSLRGIFRAVLHTYLRCEDETHNPWRRGTTWSRPHQEYAADFMACVKRTLTPEELRLFRARHLKVEWHHHCRARSTRDEFFSALSKIELKLALAFLETRPYALYPASAYFAFRGDPCPDDAASDIPITAARAFLTPAAPPARLSTWLQAQRSSCRTAGAC